MSVRRSPIDLYKSEDIIDVVEALRPYLDTMLDAQKEIATQIVAQEDDYLLATKQN